MTFTAADQGCYLDGHFGWHNTYRVVQLAQSFGFVVDDADDVHALEAYEDGSADDAQWEAVAGQGGLADKATDFLNGLTEEGLAWIWDCGELCLLAVDEDGEVIFA